MYFKEENSSYIKKSKRQNFLSLLFLNRFNKLSVEINILIKIFNKF